MMHWQRSNFLSIALVALLLSLVFVLACGGSATDEPEAMDPTAVPTAAVVVEATQPPIAPTIAPAPRGEVMEFPLVPDWASQARHESMVLQIVQRIKPGEVDLHRCSSTLSCQRIFSPRFNQLIQYDPINITEITGDLASSWEVSEDGLNYTFTLHDANWHDGQPVTADDIVFTLDRIVQRPGPARRETDQDRGPQGILRIPDSRGGRRKNRKHAPYFSRGDLPACAGQRVHEDVPQARG